MADDGPTATADDAAEHEALPAPLPLPGAKRGPVQWRVVRAAVVAALVALAGGAAVGDAREEESDDGAVASGTALAVPVLAPAVGDDLSTAVSSYGIAPWSSPTRSVVLGAWGAAAVDLETGGVAPALPSIEGEPLLADDPRLGDPAAPAFVDPCAVRGEVPTGCPGAADGAVPAEVFAATDRPANAVVVRPYPQGDTALAASCDFADLEPGAIPIAVITANPGTVRLTVGDQQVSADSSRAEVREWTTWRERPLGTRPASSFVAHCIEVPQPAGPGPYPVHAVADDGRGEPVTADGAVVPMPDGGAPASAVVLDGSLLQVEVPIAEGGGPSSVLAVPLTATGGAADCNVALVAAGGRPAGWRLGAASLSTPPAVEGTRPYLAGVPQVDRVVVPVAEGEPSLLCIWRAQDLTQPAVPVLVAAPDARRVRISVAEVEVAEGTEVEVTGTFAELGWTPCGARLGATAAPPAEVTEGEEIPADDPASDPVDAEAPAVDAPAADGATVVAPTSALLCESGGDAGAIVSAGGLLDLAITSGPATYAARISLDPRPGGPADRAYRLPVPAGDQEAGVLCTAGAEVTGCRPPAGANLAGTVLITVDWDEGPIGTADWSFSAPA
jgi:hypothetical protein